MKTNTKNAHACLIHNGTIQFGRRLGSRICRPDQLETAIFIFQNRLQVLLHFYRFGMLLDLVWPPRGVPQAGVDAGHPRVRPNLREVEAALRVGCENAADETVHADLPVGPRPNEVHIADVGHHLHQRALWLGAERKLAMLKDV